MNKFKCMKASAFVIGAMAMIALGGGIFFRGDDSVGVSAGPSGTVDGITLRPVLSSFDGRELVVTVRVEGREELGEVVARFDRPKFSDGRGGVSYTSRSWSDQADPRLIVAAFEISGGPQTSAGMFEVRELGFLSTGEAAAARQSGVSQPRRVAGGWRVPVQAVNTAGQVRTIEINARQPLGTRGIRVQRVSITANSITVHGQLEGFSPEQIQEIILAPATLTGAVGAGEFLSGRSGFGTELADFELTFAKVGGNAQLSIPLNVAGITAGGRAQNQPAAESLRAVAGLVSSFDLNLDQP